MEGFLMKKIAIVVDSSASFTPKEIQETGVYVAPLTIIYDTKEYVDQVTITNDKVADLLKDNAVITTSQPNLGTLITLFEELKSKNYDHIIALPLSRHLSGTYDAFAHAAKEVGLSNLTMVDTLTLVGVIQHAVHKIIALNKEDKDLDAILAALQNIWDNTESYLIPKTLKQLKASGRISPAAGTLASLLRIKPILKLWNKGETIDKFDTARTDAKAYDIVIQDLIKNNVSPKTHKLYFLEAKGEAELNAFKTALESKLGVFESHTSVLPSSLVTHAGLGTIVIQVVPL
jgi:DegV family protein with EDD domain